MPERRLFLLYSRSSSHGKGFKKSHLVQACNTCQITWECCESVCCISFARTYNRQSAWIVDFARARPATITAPSIHVMPMIAHLHGTS